MNQYEAMFLFDPTFGTSFEKCEEEIRRLMDRAEAEIILCRKWDERRLAYRIQGRKRGVYVLTYFNSRPEMIAPLERDVKLSEVLLRMLVLAADDVPREAMERSFGAWSEEPSKSGNDNAVAPKVSPDKAKDDAPVGASVAESAVSDTPAVDPSSEKKTTAE